MVKKEFTIILLLLTLLVSSGCAQKPKIDHQVLQDLQTKNVSDVIVVISPTASEELKNDLRLIGLEADDNGIFSGIIDTRELNELKNKGEVLEVNKKIAIEKLPVIILPQNGGQISAEEDEQAYERLRKERNITVGPYIEDKVVDQIEKEGNAYVGIAFRLGQSEETYHGYIESINAYMTKDELKHIEVKGIGRAFRAIISNSGLNKLRNDSRILSIELVRSLPWQPSAQLIIHQKNLT